MFPREPTTPVLPSHSEAYASATFSAVRSKRSNSTQRERAHTTSEAPPALSSASSSAGSSSRPSLPRSFTHVRKRSDSLATTDTGASLSGDTTSATSISAAAAQVQSAQNQNQKGSTSKRMSVSVSGWMDSLGSRSRKNSHGKKNFQTLGDDEDVREEGLRGQDRTPRPDVPSRSGSTMRKAPPPPPRRSAAAFSTDRVLQSNSSDHYESSTDLDDSADHEFKSMYDPSAPAIRVKALYSFASVRSNELGFRRGDSLTLRAELPSELYASLGTAKFQRETDSVSWIWAERDVADGGGVGLIPLNYVEISSTTEQAKSHAGSRSRAESRSRRGSVSVLDDPEASDSPSSFLLHDAPRSDRGGGITSGRRYSTVKSKSQSSPELVRFPPSEDYHEEDNEPFGDHHHDNNAVNIRPSPPFVEAPNPALSSSTSTRPPPPVPTRPSIAKKAPPPPPPPARRAHSTANLHASSQSQASSPALAPHLALPPVPARPSTVLRSTSDFPASAMRGRSRSVVDSEMLDNESPFGS